MPCLARAGPGPGPAALFGPGPGPGPNFGVPGLPIEFLWEVWGGLAWTKRFKLDHFVQALEKQPVDKSVEFYCFVHSN